MVTSEIKLIRLNHPKLSLIAGTSKRVSQALLLLFMVLGGTVLGVVYHQGELSQWYWKVMLVVGCVFVMLPLNPANHRATLNISVDDDFFYLILPYPYKNCYLQLARSSVRKFVRCSVASKYRGVGVIVDIATMPDVLRSELEFMIKDVDDKNLTLEVNAGMTSYFKIHALLKAKGIKNEKIDQLK